MMIKVVNGKKLYPIGKIENTQHKLENELVRMRNKIDDIYFGLSEGNADKLEELYEELESAQENLYYGDDGLYYGEYSVYKVCRQYINLYDIRH